MTEKEIQLLGFEKQEELDSENPFYYYTYVVARGLEFITNANNECINSEWFVEFFDTYPNIRFTKFSQVQSLINTLEKNVINDTETKG